MKPARFLHALVAPILAALLLALPASAEVRIREVKTPGGFTAWLSEDHGLPFTALEIAFDGGTSLDAPGKRGAVNLMTALIEEGAGDLDSRGFAEARDALGAGFSFAAGPDSVSVSARFLSENRDRAVALLQSALVAPRFDADAVERVRGQVLANLRAARTDPGSIASEAFDAAAFGDHPYATSGDGTIESVTALTRADIVAAHRNALARDRVTIAAAGDITPDELAALLDTLLGGLPETGAPLPGRAPWLLPPGVQVIDFPAPQSLVRFGQKGIARDDPDFFAAYILNEVLGGGRFSARLMTEVRDRRGLTYGIGTALYGLDHADLLMGQFVASNDKVAEAIAVIRDQWSRLANEGITEAELAATKTWMTGSYPLRFDGNIPIARMLLGLQLQHLPIDYIHTRDEKIAAVTLADVRRVAKALLDPAALRFVVVGQPTGLESSP